ncbi:MAG: alkaline phosphatase family protein, partial [Helcococcus sp.]|nr:alkaline phosphatase family protein [Helcococcus sp.]
NTKIQPERSNPDWFWQEKFIKSQTFQQLATKNGYDVMCLLWPVTARAKIKYNLPEIFPNRPWQNQIMVNMLNGSIRFQLDLFSKNKSLLDGLKQPNLDNFTHANLLYAARKYKPDISMVHYIELDTQRHDYGFSSNEAIRALDHHDERLGDIINHIEKYDGWENTTLIVLGDHSCKDASNVIFLNTLLKEKGYIQTDDKGNIKNWSVLAKESGGSCYIYSKDKSKFKIIKNLIEENIGYDAIEKIYTSDEANEMGADPKCLMMLEANVDYLFENGIAPKAVMSLEELRNVDISYHTNNHGYNTHTKIDYETVFMAKGRKIKKNVEIKEMCLVDEGPTFAKILGLDLGETDGRVLEEILSGE